MDRLSGQQFELFSEKIQSGESARKKSSSFIEQMRQHDKAIILTMVFIISGLICFSVGVEKGKTIGKAKITQNIDLAVNKTVATVSLPENKTPPKTIELNKQTVIKQTEKIVPQNAISTPAKEKSPTLTKFTIQVASFQGKTNAEKEAKLLKKKGFAALILSKGSYAILCVGKFENKLTAQSTLAELKKQYKDCFIRRM